MLVSTCLILILASSLWLNKTRRPSEYLDLKIYLYCMKWWGGGGHLHSENLSNFCFNKIFSSYVNEWIRYIKKFLQEKLENKFRWITFLFYFLHRDVTILNSNNYKVFIIKGFQTIVFIFIISTTFQPICPLAFFRWLSNSETFTELWTTSIIEYTGGRLFSSEQATHVDSIKDVVPWRFLSSTNTWRLENISAEMLWK